MNTGEIADKKLESISGTSDLAEAIRRLERKKAAMEEDLKEQFHQLAEDFKPRNILKNTIHEVQQSTDLKHNLLKVVLGLGAGYFSRKLLVNKSAGFIKKALGTAIQYGVTNFVAKKDDEDYEGHYKKKNLFRRILSI